MGTMKRDVFITTQLFAERLIPIRFGSSEMEITMGSMHFIAHFIEQQKQCDTICTTT